MRNIHGLKTKLGCAVIVAAALIHVFNAAFGVRAFMLGAALALYGLYDRRGRDLRELRQRTKKPTLRNEP